MAQLIKMGVAALLLVAIGGAAAEAGWGHGYGGGYRGGYGRHTYHNHGYWGPAYAPRVQRYHDTSHYHYHRPSVVPHRNHYHYVPGHYDYHRTGHYHY